MDEKTTENGLVRFGLTDTEIGEVASHLCAVLGMLDPTDDADWHALSDAEREIYLVCTKEVLLEVERAYRRRPATTK